MGVTRQPVGRVDSEGAAHSQAAVDQQSKLTAVDEQREPPSMDGQQASTVGIHGEALRVDAQEERSKPCWRRRLSSSRHNSKE
ncbi:unnamed protein product [Toxocara canis]|uniref:Uncharacterized protein n=1 Tax=Toxocara canis TaxID=6265 RepID=A0A183V246_TOXCA|nr:unnamed protein product [Toxocara canis]